jgi:hypothetical protein
VTSKTFVAASWFSLRLKNCEFVFSDVAPSGRRDGGSEVAWICVQPPAEYWPGGLCPGALSYGLAAELATPVRHAGLDMAGRSAGVAPPTQC